MVEHIQASEMSDMLDCEMRTEPQLIESVGWHYHRPSIFYRGEWMPMAYTTLKDDVGCISQGKTPEDAIANAKRDIQTSIKRGFGARLSRDPLCLSIISRYSDG